MKKVKLITGAGGNLLEFSKPKEELEKYAKTHKFDFEFKEYDDNYKLQKLFQIRESLEQDYDYIIWVDYDIRVRDYENNIMDDIKLTNYNIYVAKHNIKAGSLLRNIMNGLESYWVDNTGVMILKNTRYTKDLIETMIFLVNEYYENWELVDNAAFLNATGQAWILNKLYFNHNYKQINKIFEDIGELSPEFNYIRGKHKYELQVPIVFEHFAGVINREDYLR